MMKLIQTPVFISILLLLPTFTFGESDSGTKQEKYLIWIYTTSNHCKYSGILYQVNDSSIIMISRRKSERTHCGKIQTFAVDSIKTIKLRKKGNKAVGLINGGIIAGAVAIFAGALATQDGKNEPFVVGSSTYLMGLGLATGFIIGCKKTTIHLHGDIEVYRKYKKGLERLSLLNHEH